ncbi:hypothetical protein [Fervidibacter sacchari]
MWREVVKSRGVTPQKAAILPLALRHSPFVAVSRPNGLLTRNSPNHILLCTSRPALKGTF